MPLNEPAEVTLLGYALGEHAPGKQLLFDALPTAHHQLLAPGLAVPALRAAGARSVGIAVSPWYRDMIAAQKRGRDD